MTSVIFDLDGTLIDSAPDIAAAVNAALREIGIAPVPVPTIRTFVGNGLPKLVERTIAHCELPADSHATLMPRVLHHYDIESRRGSMPYPNVLASLTELRDAGYHLGICTNKPDSATHAVLETLQITDWFLAVTGGDTLTTRKPDPAPLAHTIAQMDGAPAIFVGDSDVDAETAKRAGVPFLLFTEGYRKSPVSALPHDRAFDDFAALPGLVDELASRLCAGRAAE